MPTHHQHGARRINRRNSHRLRQHDHVLIEADPVWQIDRQPLQRAPAE
jgi:hypothetical protein